MNAIWVLVFAHVIAGHVEVQKLATYSSQAACERSVSLHKPDATMTWVCIDVKP
jgi:hypothetical protein